MREALAYLPQILPAYIAYVIAVVSPGPAIMATCMPEEFRAAAEPKGSGRTRQPPIVMTSCVRDAQPVSLDHFIHHVLQQFQVPIDQPFRLFAAVRATCESCSGLTPDTPTAPTTCPSTMTSKLVEKSANAFCRII